MDVSEFDRELYKSNLASLLEILPERIRLIVSGGSTTVDARITSSTTGAAQQILTRLEPLATNMSAASAALGAPVLSTTTPFATSAPSPSPPPSSAPSPPAAGGSASGISSGLTGASEGTDPQAIVIMVMLVLVVALLGVLYVCRHRIWKAVEKRRAPKDVETLAAGVTPIRHSNAHDAATPPSPKADFPTSWVENETPHATPASPDAMAVQRASLLRLEPIFLAADTSPPGQRPASAETTKRSVMSNPLKNAMAAALPREEALDGPPSRRLACTTSPLAPSPARNESSTVEPVVEADDPVAKVNVATAERARDLRI